MLTALFNRLNVLTGAGKSVTFPMYLTPMISFSGYARSPGAGEYFWMSLSMYACKNQQTLGWQWSASTFHLFSSWACYEQKDLITISVIISCDLTACHTMSHHVSHHVKSCHAMLHHVSCHVIFVILLILFCWCANFHGPYKNYLCSINQSFLNIF